MDGNFLVGCRSRRASWRHCLFVISGFLITTLLLKEANRTGTISLRTFYSRRAYAYCRSTSTFFAVVLLFVCLGQVHFAPTLLDCRCFVTMSLIPVTHAVPIAHLWSLSVEEQFLHGMAILLRALGNTLAAINVILVYLLITPLIRYVIARYFSATWDVTTCSFTQ